MDLSPTDRGSVSVLSYRRSKPLGKVKRRVQDLRHKVAAAGTPRLDLSHNEAARLAMDSLLSRGLEGYKEVLSEEGEVDFLSRPEKRYIMKHGQESNTADPDVCAEKESDDSSGSKSSSQCPTLSSHSDRTVADIVADTDPDKHKDQFDPFGVLNPSSEENEKWYLSYHMWLSAIYLLPSGVVKTGRGPGQFRIYFQCDHRACGMKDVVIELIRKAEKVLAIVIDSFSDMELLFDVLEASKRRNVSVYLLLDHLNLDHFVNMWQHLKLNSKHFPKLSVRSVGGQTYSAKTGWKLTGQIAESFVIADWTEVLTGSFSFSWLSWHLYRSLVVYLKGSMAEGFPYEFYRLYACSKPVPGFIDISLPPLDTLLPTQNMETSVSTPKEQQTKTVSIEDLAEEARDTEMKPNMPDLPEIQSPELKCSTSDNQPPHKTEPGAEVPEKPAQMDPKPLVQDLQSAPEGKPKDTKEAVDTPHDAQTNVDPQEKEKNKIQPESSTASESPTVSTASESPTASTASESPTASTASESKVRVHDSAVRQQTATWLKQKSSDTLTKPTGLNTPRRHWNCTLDFKPNMPQQVNPTARLPWMSLSHRAARLSTFDSVHSAGQNQSAQAGWRPFQSSMYSGLQRSTSVNERGSAGFMRAGRYLSVS